jgi:hypothetical protein
MPEWLEMTLLVIGAGWIVLMLLVKARGRSAGQPFSENQSSELQAIMKRLAALPPQPSLEQKQQKLLDMKALMQMFRDDPSTAAEFPNHVRNLGADIARLEQELATFGKGA